MKIFLLVALAVFCFDKRAFTQETKFIVKRNSEYTEEYYVLKDNKKIKHGTYVKYKKPGISISTYSISFGPSQLHIIANGNYENGLKSGLWEYYHDYKNGHFLTNSIKVRGNYLNGMKQGVWTSYYLDSIPEVVQGKESGTQNRSNSLNINITHNATNLQTVGEYLNDKRIGEWVSFDYLGDEFQRYDFTREKLIKDKSLKDTVDLNKNRKALFLGGEPCLSDFLLYEIEFKHLIPKINFDSISIVVSFLINKEGNVLQPEILTSNAPKAFDSEVIRLVTLTNNNWLPSILNGERIDTKYKLRYFMVRESTREFQIGFKPIFD